MTLRIFSTLTMTVTRLLEEFVHTLPSLWMMLPFMVVVVKVMVLMMMLTVVAMEQVPH